MKGQYAHEPFQQFKQLSQELQTSLKRERLVAYELRIYFVQQVGYSRMELRHR